MYWLFVNPSQYIFPIDRHCKTQSELTEMLKNSPNLLDGLESQEEWFVMKLCGCR